MKYKEYNAEMARKRTGEARKSIHYIDDVLFVFLDWLEEIFETLFLARTIHKIHKEIKYYSHKNARGCDYFLKVSDFEVNELVKQSVKEILESEGYNVNVGNSFYKKDYYAQGEQYYTTITIAW